MISMKSRCLIFLVATMGAASSPAAPAALPETFSTRATAIVKEYLDWRPGLGVALGLHEYDGKAPDLSAVSIASAISGKVSRSMSGIARRIAQMLEPEAKPVAKPASSINRAPMPSPQPGMI